MNKKFKNGVSNWILKFTDQEIKLDTIQSENITYYCNGVTEITINDISISNELLDLFREGKEVEEIKQELLLVDTNVNYCHETWTYTDMKIKKIWITSRQDEISVLSLFLKND